MVMQHIYYQADEIVKKNYAIPKLKMSLRSAPRALWQSIFCIAFVVRAFGRLS
jgi:hypothetical protein